MRKALLTLLLAGAAASPALAQDYHQDPRQARAERQQARSDRQSAREEARPQRAERQASAPRADFSQRSNFAAPARPDRSAVRQQFVAPAAPANQLRAQQRDQARDNRLIEQQQRQAAVQDRVQQRQDRRQDRPPLVNGRPPVSHTPQPGTQPPAPATNTGYRPTTSWSSMWRTQPQYDWRNYRNRHRSQFHLGFYYDPFGWGYQRYDIGWRMWPSYYGSSFWINNPWDYRLPYAPPGTHWVRYYNDAVLVDGWSGEVVDVIYDFFW